MVRSLYQGQPEGLAGVLMIEGALTWVSVPIALIIGTVSAVSVFKAVYIRQSHEQRPEHVQHKLVPANHLALHALTGPIELAASTPKSWEIVGTDDNSSSVRQHLYPSA
jgi:hypothetical protein